MNLENQLALSYYQEIAVLNEEHHISVVQHRETKKIYVKKLLTVYNGEVYRRLQQLNLEGVPRIREFLEGEGQAVLIEEYISGDTLQEKIDTCRLTEKDIRRYTGELCRILNSLHQQEPPMIHRDIKPSNIIITPEDRVVLIDFNAAKSYTPGKAEDTMLIGTKGFAAPEQYGFGSSSPLTDIYGMGVLIRELTGRIRVYEKVPEIYEKVIQRCTQMNPEDRYQSVQELASTLGNTKDFTYSDGKSQEQKETQWRKYCPPGFRTPVLWKNFLAFAGYFVLLSVSMGITVEKTYGAALWINRICFLLCALVLVFVGGNYLGIQKLMPLCGSKKRSVHYLGIVLLDTCLIFLLLLLLEMVLRYF